MIFISSSLISAISDDFHIIICNSHFSLVQKKEVRKTNNNKKLFFSHLLFLFFFFTATRWFKRSRYMNAGRESYEY